MPHVYKLSMEGLKRIIAEEKSKLIRKMGEAKSGFGLVGDPSKKAKQTKEINADEHGTEKVHEKDLDQLKAQKVQEQKLLMQLKRLRESMRAQRKQLAEKRHPARRAGPRK